MSAPHDDPLRRHLAGLRDPVPSPDLFGRIERSRRQRRRRRVLLRGVAAAVVLVAALLPLRGLLAPPPSHGDRLADSVPGLAPDSADAALRRIDRQLQAAYDRGADAETLQTLWLARERVAAAAHTLETDDDSIISL